MKRVVMFALVAILFGSCGEDITIKTIQAYSNGSRKTEADFIENGKVKIAQRTYQENGKLLREGPIKDDMREGVWTFYDLDGILKSKKTYAKGKYNGTYQEFYPNGELKIEGQYENGERVGDWKTLKQKKDQEATQKNDEKPFNFREAQGMDGGTPPVAQKNVLERYESGKVKVEMLLKPDGTNFDEQIAYYENGQIMMRGKYVNNLKDGQWTSYYENGLVQSVNNYREDKFHGDYSLHFETGAVKVQGEYNEGKQTGEWISYSESGKIIKHLFYDENGNILETLK